MQPSGQDDGSMEGNNVPDAGPQQDIDGQVPETLDNTQVPEANPEGEAA